MYEDQNYDNIMTRILENVDSSFHKDEGSFIYTATAPTAAEHERIYTEMDVVLSNMFPTTADREYLIKHAAQRGIAPKEATEAYWKAQAMPIDTSVPIGTRFNYSGKINLRVIRSDDEGIYTLVCEDAGTGGNNIAGALTPINYVEGLDSMTLIELTEAASDVESTEDFRTRFLAYLQKPPTSGNKSEYYHWAVSVDGIGAAAVFGAGDTVDDETVPAGEVWVYLADNRKRAAGQELVSKVKTYIDSVRPIGAKVTVSAAEELLINIKAKVVMNQTPDVATLQSSLKNAVSEYLESNTFELKRVSIAKIGDMIFDAVGAEDYTELTLNGTAASVSIGSKQLARVGTVELEVAAE